MKGCGTVACRVDHSRRDEQVERQTHAHRATLLVVTSSTPGSYGVRYEPIVRLAWPAETRAALFKLKYVGG